jgi:hypothetical protein
MEPQSDVCQPRCALTPPGNDSRLFAGATGMEHVLVKGQEIAVAVQNAHRPIHDAVA